MFIPYNNAELFPNLSSPNMSGNMGHHDDISDEKRHEIYTDLGHEALKDPLWNNHEIFDYDLIHEDLKVIRGGRCSHCKHWVGDKGAELVQIQHVLNGCKSFKTQRRYHWRHEVVLDFLGLLLEKKSEPGWTAFRCYLDVPGRRTHDDGTVPDQLLVTSDKPDIFILDQRDHLLR